MAIIDITRGLLGAPLYPGAKAPKMRTLLDMKEGAPYNLTYLSMESHSGTHGDAYNHFLKESGVGIDRMPLDHYYGLCRVVSFSAPLITRAMLEGKVEGCERLVIHGGGESYLSTDGALYLSEIGVTTVVTDALSVAPLEEALEREVHQLLLGAEMAIIENVILDGVADGDYLLSAFPLKIEGCDGAPVRAVLIEIKEDGKK